MLIRITIIHTHTDKEVENVNVHAERTITAVRAIHIWDKKNPHPVCLYSLKSKTYLFTLTKSINCYFLFYY